MLGENHALIFEFPKYKDAIHNLKMSDEDFARMAKEYHSLDHRIRGLEKNAIPTSDSTFTSLKTRRVELKDAIYQRLSNGHG